MSVAPLETLLACFEGDSGCGVWFGCYSFSAHFGSDASTAMGSQARDPLGAPALAHASLACFAGSLTHRFG
ncbi:hypothetical protein B4902_12100 [Yersinia frederiksenii]|nr:hypothetical protein B4902_12100 [Yersinia frederiksenii]